MRKMSIILLLGSLILLLMGCLPATFPGTEPDAEAATAVPTLPAASAPTEPVPSATAVPTKAVALTVVPLPTISLEKEPMPNDPGNVVKSSADAHPEAVSIAVQDLAKQLNIEETEIEAVAVEMVIWPDASMGCPHLDMAYKQVRQDGLRIHLRVGNQIYAYHSGDSRPPFLCENPTNIIKPVPGSDEMVPPPGFNE